MHNIVLYLSAMRLILLSFLLISELSGAAVIEAPAPTPRSSDICKISLVPPEAYQLQTERLRLRPLTIDDYYAMAVINLHPKIQEMEVITVDENSLLQLLMASEKSLTDGFKGDLMVFGIFYEDRIIGDVYIAKSNTSHSFGSKAETEKGLWVEVGYAIDPDYWGKGFATEAVGKILEFASQKLNPVGVEALVVSKNHGSMGVLKKLGFRLAESIESEVHGTFHRFVWRNSY